MIIVVFSFFFQNLNKNPTVIQAKMCVIKRRIPIIVLPYINMPTVPIINKGPELFVKLRSLKTHSIHTK